jgi:hypothetical protein
MVMLVIVVVMAVIVIVVVAVLVLTQPLAGDGVHRCLGRPLAIEAVLGLAPRPDTEEATEPEAPLSATTARGTGHRVRDRRRREDLMDGGTGVTPVVDERHASRILAGQYRRLGHGTRMRPQGGAQVSQLGTRQIE